MNRLEAEPRHFGNDRNQAVPHQPAGQQRPREVTANLAGGPPLEDQSGTQPDDAHAPVSCLEVVEEVLDLGLVPRVERSRYATNRPGFIDGAVLRPLRI